MTRAFTIWLTGRPRAGKTTLGGLLCRALTDLGLAAEYLDGDELRRALSPGLGFSAQERRSHALRAAYLAGMLNRHGVICVVGLISPQAEARREARRQLGEFVEVYLDCPLEQAINRDQTGLYQKALAGQIKNLTGLDDPYEPPQDPELHLHTHRQGPRECLEAIFGFLDQAGLLPALGARADSGQAAEVYSPAEERQIKQRLRALGYL
ncbi:MAG: adenylyl-sulfate kinase [Desulfarculus sp.]|nr:adenylyl-sulfate kinase [Desulfarculus sp.]